MDELRSRVVSVKVVKKYQGVNSYVSRLSAGDWIIETDLNTRSVQNTHTCTFLSPSEAAGEHSSL